MAPEPTDRLSYDERKTGERQLALEIRSRKFAFAVLERSELIDWGSCRFASGSPKSAVDRRLAFLLKLYAPSLVIARSPRRVKDERSNNAFGVFRQVRAELERHSIPFVVFGNREVPRFFAERGYTNKSQVAASIADQFSPLRSRLPRPRRPWDPERRIVAVFDAVATAFMFNALHATTIGET
jgi:hypothetical protein